MSIIPRGLTSGVTFSALEGDPLQLFESEIHAKIKAALGGRGAEEIVFGQVSTGAESDIQQAHRARAPDGRLPGDDRGDRPGGGAPARRCRAAPPRARRGAGGDTEAARRRGARIVAEFVIEAHREGSELLCANRDRLDALVATPPAHMTLAEDEADAAAAVARGTAAPPSRTAAARSASPPG